MVEDEIEHQRQEILITLEADDTVDVAKILHGVSVADVVGITAFLGLATQILG